MRRRLALTLAIVLAAVSLALLPSRPAAALVTTKLYMPLLACPGCSGTSSRPTATPRPTTTPIGIAPERLEVIELVNQARLAAGCPAARVNNTLMAASQGWSEYMDETGDYRHSFGTWYDEEYGYTTPILENIGVSGTAEQIFGAWMESAAHRENMLSCPEHDPNYFPYDPNTIYEIGVGHSNGYWTLGLGTVFP